MRPSRRFVLVYVCLALYAGVFHASAQAVSQKASSPPLWQLEIPRNEPPKDFLGPRVVSDQARVFYLQGGQVKAVNAATRRQLWTYQIGKWAQLRYGSGWLLAITYNGKVVALNAQTGRVHWSRMGAGVIYAVDDKSLYVAEEQKLYALDLATGKEKWLTREPFFNAWEPFTAIKNRIFVYVVNGDAIFAETYIYDARTGKRLGKADTRDLLAILDQKVFFQNDWFQADYADNAYINVYDLQTGKLLEERTYTVKNRTSGSDWSIAMAVSKAVYISGGGNIACFPLSAPGGKAKPNLIRVPRGDVQWLAGPRHGTFLLEWQDNLWLARQQQRPCTPIVLQKQGIRLTAGKLAHTDIVRTRVDTMKNGMYIGLKNGTFYAVNTKTGGVVLELALRSYAFGPTHVVGNTLVIQAGNRLLAYPLPESLKP